MRLPEEKTVPSQLASVSASGALISPKEPQFVPRLPSTWPSVGERPDARFVDVLQRLFIDGMLAELENVCSDVLSVNDSLQGRGHVIGITLMVILDSVSCFAYPDQRQHQRILKYVEGYMPSEYHPVATDINSWYRNGLVHEWFMRKVALLPGNEPLIVESSGSPVVGLLTFKAALSASIECFLQALRNDSEKRAIAATRYRALQEDVRA